LVLFIIYYPFLVVAFFFNSFIFNMTEHKVLQCGSLVRPFQQLHPHVHLQAQQHHFTFTMPEGMDQSHLSSLRNNGESFPMFPSNVIPSINGIMPQGFPPQVPFYQGLNRAAMSDIGPRKPRGRSELKKRSRADLTKSMQYFGINTTEATRFTLASGGGDFAEKEMLRAIKLPHSNNSETPKTNEEDNEEKTNGKCSNGDQGEGGKENKKEADESSNLSSPVTESPSSKSHSVHKEKRTSTKSEKEMKRTRNGKKTSEVAKRRLVYWLDPSQEICFVDVADGSSLSYIILQKIDVICISSPLLFDFFNHFPTFY
jgi:hypothetical protein